MCTPYQNEYTLLARESFSEGMYGMPERYGSDPTASPAARRERDDIREPPCVRHLHANFCLRSKTQSTTSTPPQTTNAFARPTSRASGPLSTPSVSPTVSPE